MAAPDAQDALRRAMLFAAGLPRNVPPASAARLRCGSGTRRARSSPARPACSAAAATSRARSSPITACWSPPATAWA
jgi:hypothetical protein